MRYSYEFKMMCVELYHSGSYPDIPEGLNPNTLKRHIREWSRLVDLHGPEVLKTSVYKGYKQDKIEMRGDRAEMSDFPLYLNMVTGGLDCRDQAIGGFSFVVKIYAVPVVEIIG